MFQASEAPRQRRLRDGRLGFLHLGDAEEHGGKRGVGGAMVKGARSGGAPDGCALTERWNMLILG